MIAAAATPGEPSRYERQAALGIQRWKHRGERGWRKLVRAISWPIDKAGELVLATPGIGWVIEKSVGGVMSLINEASQWSVRPSAIYGEFRANGDQVASPEDIHRLDLKSVDRAIGSLKAKYVSLAAAEGVITGSLGLPGIPPDIVALTATALRAVGEYATYCGFDVRLQHERLYAVQILALGSASQAAAKTVAMAELAKVARLAVGKKAWSELERYTSVRVMQEIAKTLGVRLTKAKLAEIAPLVGAPIGAGFNAFFVGAVCDAAYHLYRERFLAEKYGEAMISA